MRARAYVCTMTEPAPLPAPPLWTRDEVIAYLQITSSMFDTLRHRTDPPFPRAIRLGHRTLRWPPEEVIAYLGKLRAREGDQDDP